MWKRSRWMLSGMLSLALAVTVGASAARAEELPTRENPLIVDKANKRLLIYTEVNEMYLYQSTVHWGVVFREGTFGDRAILKAWANQLDFHDGLVELGLKPGNNLRHDTVGKLVEGDELTIHATWPGLGKEVPLEEFFAESSGKGFKIKFGGNRKASAEKKTGCITCLESCWISISSNAQYPMSKSPERFSHPHSTFKGRPEVLPVKDQSPVVLIYRKAATRTAKAK
jgi:hypothetical protein